MTNVSFKNCLINFGFATLEEKKQVLRESAHLNVYMDLTTYDGEALYQEFPQLKGIFSALFCDERKKIEIHFRERNQDAAEKFLELGFHLTEISFVSLGFVFPRTIAQIINEAHFAFEEKVASREDINRAMKFGVNYPKGPFEWSEGRESIVKTLLQELHKKTNDKRYLASPLLDRKL